MAKKIRLFLPIIVLVLFTVILFKPYFLKGKVPIPGDILIGHYHPWVDEVWESKTAGYPVKNFILFDGIRQTFPWRLLAIEQIRGGHWPLWNPYILSGMPLLGNLQVAAFYPLNILFFILPKLDAWSIYIFLQPILAGFFTYFFLRTLACSRKASLLGGIGYGFSSIMMNHLEFGIDGHTALWLPLGLGAINKIQQSGRWRWGIVLMISIGMSFLGGYPPPVIYNLLLLIAYSLFKIRPLKSQKTLMILLSLSFAFLLTAPQILPALELSKKIIREETQFGVLSNETYFFPFENLIMIIAPDFFGHPATNNFFSRIDYVDNPSIGIIGFLLALFSVWGFSKKREIIFWWIVTFFPMFLMLPTPLGKILRLLPISAFSLVTPMRMIWVVAFSLSILAAIGIDVVSILIRKKQFWKTFLPIIFIWEIIFLLWGATFLLIKNEHMQVAQRNLILPTIFFGSSSFLLVFNILFPKFWPVFASFIILFSGTELVRQGIKYNPFISRGLVFPQTEILKKIQEDREYWRTMITHPELLPVNSNIPYHISMIDGYASIYDGRYGQMVGLAGAGFPLKKIGTYPRVVFQTEYRSPIINLLNVKYVLTLKEFKDQKLKLIQQEGKTLLYENKDVLPKAFFVQKYLVGKDNLDVANRVITSNLAKEVVLEKSPGINLTEGETGKIEIVDYNNNQVIIKTSNENSGILVLTDSFDPGWKAYVDEEKTKILRADYDLRAIVVPAGNHLIKFIYKPLSFKIGLYLSLSAFLMLLGGSVAISRFKKERW